MSASADDREFLPASLAVIAVPPSPIAVYLLWLICALAATALLWGYLGKIDITATASGKLRPSGRVKLIQPAEAGRVMQLHAHNGDRVNAGDVLIELEPDDADADASAVTAQLTAFRAEAARRALAMNAALRDQFDTALPVLPDIPPTIHAREAAVLRADLEHLFGRLQSFTAQIRQKESERQSLQATLAAQKRLLVSLNERVNMKQTLFDQHFGTKAVLLDALEKLREQEATAVAESGRLIELARAIDVLQSDKLKEKQAFIAEHAAKESEARRRMDDLEQNLIKAQFRKSHMLLRAPIAGVINASAVTGVGQVLSAGQEAMRIVPDDALILEAYLPNKDIGFVHAGQSARVKLEAFPFTRYGTINAQVTHVAHDAVLQTDALRVDNGKPQMTGETSPDQATGNPVFPVTLRLESDTIAIDGTPMRLSPGMAATVEIHTGKRRVLEYLLAPLAETADRSMQER